MYERFPIHGIDLVAVRSLKISCVDKIAYSSDKAGEVTQSNRNNSNKRTTPPSVIVLPSDDDDDHRSHFAGALLNLPRQSASI